MTQTMSRRLLFAPPLLVAPLRAFAGKTPAPRDADRTPHNPPIVSRKIHITID